MKALVFSLAISAMIAPAAFAKVGYEPAPAYGVAVVYKTAPAYHLTSFEYNQLKKAIRGFTPEGLTQAQLSGLLGTLNNGDGDHNRLPNALYQTYRQQNQK